MPRPSQIDEQRKRLLPIVCEVFRDFGYHATTTARLADRCGVRENVLYRLWQDKKAMFIAAIYYIYDLSVERWGKVLAECTDSSDVIESLVSYEAEHHGEFGFYRVVFTALVEADDPEIRSALLWMYRGLHKQIRQMIEANPTRVNATPEIPQEAAAWALIGLATISNIMKELELVKPKQREAMFKTVANHLLQGGGS